MNEHKIKPIPVAYVIMFHTRTLFNGPFGTTVTGTFLYAQVKHSCQVVSPSI